MSLFVAVSQSGPPPAAQPTEPLEDEENMKVSSFPSIHHGQFGDKINEPIFKNNHPIE